jgi:mannose-6-phosphate isomerase
MNPYPLIFEPMFKPRVWGGRKMGTRLRKSLPPRPIGESWELAALESDQSVVAIGPAKGKTLSQMVELWGEKLLGRAELMGGRFPLLLKFLDADQALSVQVHPSEEAARAADDESLVKNEAWYVIDAAPDSWILRGVKPGVDQEMLRAALTRGHAEQVLNRIAIRPGHAYYIPSGTVHALGPGAVIAEVQTPSDTTYRLYDWDRVDPETGRTRELHIDEAMDSIVYEPVPAAAEHPEHIASVWTAITRLVRCESFVVERVRMVAGVEQVIPYDEMVAWMVLDGAGSIRCDGLSEPIRFGVGDTVLLPAGLKGGRVAVEEASTWLEISIPIASSLTNLNRAERESMKSDPRTNYVPLNINVDKSK